MRAYDKTMTHQTITMLVNKKHPGAIKVIEVLNPEAFQLAEQIKEWPLYSVIDLSTNKIGDLPAKKLFPSITNQKGEKLILFDGYKTKDLFDAFLFVGLAQAWKIAEIPKSVTYANEYWNELNRRRKLSE